MWYKRACIRTDTRQIHLAFDRPSNARERVRIKMSLQNIFYTRNSVLELGHVTKVTIFLKETAASGWGSR